MQMGSLVTQIYEPPLTPGEDNGIKREEHLEEAIRTIGLSYHQCLRAFKHLCRDIPGRQNK